MFNFINELKKAKALKNVSRQEAADIMAQIKIPNFLDLISKQMTWIVVSSMWLCSTLITFLYLKKILSTNLTLPVFIQAVLASVSIAIFAFSFVLIGAFWSFVARAGIIEGKFPRNGLR